MTRLLDKVCDTHGHTYKQVDSSQDSSPVLCRELKLTAGFVQDSSCIIHMGIGGPFRVFLVVVFDMVDNIPLLLVYSRD